MSIFIKIKKSSYQTYKQTNKQTDKHPYSINYIDRLGPAARRPSPRAEIKILGQFRGLFPLLCRRCSITPMLDEYIVMYYNYLNLFYLLFILIYFTFISLAHVCIITYSFIR